MNAIRANVIIGVCILVFLVSAFFLGQWLHENYKTGQLTHELQSMAGVSESTVIEEGAAVSRRLRKKNRFCYPT